MEIIILADGDFPFAAPPLQALERADKIICCDGAVHKLLKHYPDRLPDYIVGDMDTLDAASCEKFKSIIYSSTCVETNDQTKAFSFALGLIPEGETARIHILGATGKREDHTLGNISLLMDYAAENTIIAPFGNRTRPGITVDMLTDYGVFTPHTNTFTAPGTPGQQVSIFPFDNTLTLHSTGLRYPTDQVVFDLWWKATLNECTGDRYTLQFSHPARVLIFENYPERS